MDCWWAPQGKWWNLTQNNKYFCLVDDFIQWTICVAKERIRFPSSLYISPLTCILQTSHMPQEEDRVGLDRNLGSINVDSRSVGGQNSVTFPWINIYRSLKGNNSAEDWPQQILQRLTPRLCSINWIVRNIAQHVSSEKAFQVLSVWAH